LGDWSRYETEGVVDVEDFASVPMQMEEGCVEILERAYSQCEQYGAEPV
jgi:hypothetical protein